MNIKQFKEYYDKYNKKNNYELYDDNYVCVDYFAWYKDKKPNPVDYLLEFTKVFPRGEFGDITVDDNIGFIHNWEDFYINADYLTFCIDKKLSPKDSISLYYNNLETNTEIEDGNYVSFEQSYAESLLFKD